MLDICQKHSKELEYIKKILFENNEIKLIKNKKRFKS
jgi:hypothetical protein